MKRLRTFIAITPPPKFHKEAEFLINNLKKSSFPVKWQKPESLHLSLIFLGHITQARMESAAKAAEKTAAAHEPVEVIPGGLSYFYRRGADSIIFLDIQDKKRHLRNLYKTLFANLADEGFYPPTRFTPHITLGRLKRQRYEHERKRILARITEAEVPLPPRFAAEELDVYESIYAKGENTHRHHLLKSFPFGK